MQIWITRNQRMLTVVGAAGLTPAAWVVRAATAGTGVWPGAFGTLMTAAAVVAGVPIAKEAWNRLLAYQFSIPLLVTVAAVGAVWIGEAWEAAAVTFLYVFGGYLESHTLARTRQALKGLVDAAPRERPA